jgi:uncharacterized protein YaeQ
MALKATIFRAELQIADMDRGYYRDHALTLARHPSETDERMMVRLLAFALNADENLAFGKGLSTEDEPALWLRDLTGAIKLWIEVGLPDEKSVRKACGRADRVCIYSYGGHAASLWWNQTSGQVARFANLEVLELPSAATRAMAAMAQRNMRLQCSIQDGQALLTDGEHAAPVEPVALKAAQAGRY